MRSSLGARLPRLNQSRRRPWEDYYNERTLAIAARLYARAADLEPANAQLQYALGTALFNDGQFEPASTPLRRALDESPEDDNLRRMLALAWFNSESYEKAVELLRDDPERPANPSTIRRWPFRWPWFRSAAAL